MFLTYHDLSHRDNSRAGGGTFVGTYCANENLRRSEATNTV